MKRRDFCKGVPCVALTVMYPAPMKGGTTKERPIEETNMSEKIVSVKAEVIKGSCSLHKIGDAAEFTESGVKGKICIHALYSMMPAVFAMLYDAQFPWLEDKDTKTHACPDANNPVVFKISKIRGD